jgi:hypothetical protein
MLTPTSLEEIRKMITSPDEGIDPWKRMLYSAFLDSYQNPKEDKANKGKPIYDEEGNDTGRVGQGRTRFSRAYDKVISPFLSGVKNAKRSDLLPNTYREASRYDTDRDQRWKDRFNESLYNRSLYDHFLTPLSHGAGMLAASSIGGLPGVLGGMAIKNGAPLIWNIVKHKLAGKSADQGDVADRYNQLKNKYFSSYKSS